MRRPTALRLESITSMERVRSACSLAVHAGFDGIEWSIPREHLAPILAGQTSGLGFLTTLQTTDLEVIAVTAPCGSADLRETARSVIGLLDGVRMIGARCLNLTIPPIGPSPGGVGFAHYSDAMNFAYGLLRRVRFEAEAAGVAVALEAVCGGALISPVELRELVDSANSWAVGACIDVGRTLAIGSPADWIETLGRRVHSVRIDPDSPPGETRRDARPVDFAALFRALDRVPRERPIIAAGASDPDRQRAALVELGCPLEGP